jgi:hypothetical protein
MSDLKLIASRPVVKSAVLIELAPGGESVAAVRGFATSTRVQAGRLGHGPQRTSSFTGHPRECLVIVQGDSIVTNFVEPPTSVAAVEKVIDPPDGSPRGR